MTAVADRAETTGAGELVESSELETALAVQRAVERSGFTRQQLEEQARQHHFNSLSARLAWTAVRDFGDITRLRSERGPI